MDARRGGPKIVVEVHALMRVDHDARGAAVGAVCAEIKPAEMPATTIHPLLCKAVGQLRKHGAASESLPRHNPSKTSAAPAQTSHPGAARAGVD